MNRLIFFISSVKLIDCFFYSSDLKLLTRVGCATIIATSAIFCRLIKTDMPKIRLLPAHVITAIAAGEIAERPAVILKELLENSLDAGAKTISIDIHDSGLDLISISDDGEGMTAEDVALAIQRHTTSKISSLSDLEQVQSFGFRGEALASIASVAQLEIASKTDQDEAGHYLCVKNGTIIEQHPVGRATGTTITVTHLFSTLPARLKFLQHTKTEWQLLAEVVTTYAINYPEVGFWLRHNQKVVLSLPTDQTLSQRLTHILGDITDSKLIPLAYASNPLSITGFLGKPQLARKTKHHYLFINRRPIISPVISRTIKNAYSSLLEARVEPFFVVNVEINPGLIDVNVHPRKETVRFIDEKQVIQFISESIKAALHQTDTTYTFSDPAGNISPQLLTFADSNQSENEKRAVSRSDRTQSLSTSQMLKELVTSWQLQPQTTQPILQIHLTYLVATTEQGLVLIDQHAAHERILFEQYKAAYQTQTQAESLVTALTPPVVMTLSLSEAALLEENLETISQLGFSIEPFGTTSFKITTVPSLVSDHDLVITMKDLLDDLAEHQPLAGIDRATDRTLAYLACRHAIKAGAFLSLDQRQELITKLAETPQNATCPHGRPVSITYSQTDLEKLFKRH